MRLKDGESKQMDFTLEGKTAVVVGASSGIGRSIAVGLAQVGARVVCSSRRFDLNKELVEDIRTAGGKAHAVSVDATKSEEVRMLHEETIREFGFVDVLVNAVGMQKRIAFLDLTSDIWDRIIEVNLKSIYTCCQVFGAAMVKRESGSIINIGSLGSYVGLGGGSAYCASKAGVTGLTKVLAVEWAGKGVRVNCIVPGYIDTALTRSAPEFGRIRSMFVEGTAMKRMGQPEDLVGAAVYLASDVSRFTTGTSLVVDGGFLSRGIDL